MHNAYTPACDAINLDSRKVLLHTNHYTLLPSLHTSPMSEVLKLLQAFYAFVQNEILRADYKAIWVTGDRISLYTQRLKTYVHVQMTKKSWTLQKRDLRKLL